MTYHCGLLLASIGGTTQDPHLTCDGRGLVYRIPTNKPAPSWLLDNKAPRGWRREAVIEPVTNTQLPSKHYCPRCK